MSLENSLKTLVAASAKMSALNSIHQQQKLLFIAQLSQAEQILDGRCRDAALALDSFDENRDCRRGDRGSRRFEIVIRNVAETLNKRFETLLHLFLTGRGDARQRSAVE